jgi:uncharacterized protein YabE (DUF348 family)
MPKETDMRPLNPHHLAAAATILKQRLRQLLTRDDGYTSESVVTTAMLVALALTVLGIIVAKVAARANSIDLNP